MDIDQARPLTFFAASKIDTLGVKVVMTDISAIKMAAPNVLRRAVDQAIQIHGNGSMSHDIPLANLFLIARALRLTDGPDEFRHRCEQGMPDFGVGDAR